MRAKWHEASLFIVKYDVVVFSETKLDSLARLGALDIEGYFMFRHDRSCSGGGVAMYIKATLNPQHLHEHQQRAVKRGLEITIATLHDANKQIVAVIIGIYRPPSARTEWFKSFNDTLLELMAVGPLIILGDLNADLLKPRVYPGRSLKNSLKVFNTVVHKLAPTRITSSSATCLDIIAVDKSFTCLEYSTTDLAASDHRPVSVNITLGHASVVEPILKRSFAKVNYDSLLHRAQQITLPQDINTPTDDLLNQWHHQMIQILDDVTPRREFPFRRKHSPWLTTDIRLCIEYRHWLHRELSRCSVERR